MASAKEGLSHVGGPFDLARRILGMKNPIVSLSLLGLLFAWQGSAVAGEFADEVRVVKSDARLYLLREDAVVRVYDVAFGGDPVGHKEREGDERTPEGRYTLDYKKADSAYYRAIHISYPNEEDRRQARKLGVDPGGAIMIHGQRNGLGWLSWITQRFNWTDGCTAVSNEEMDEIWSMVAEGTPIEILP